MGWSALCRACGESGETLFLYSRSRLPASLSRYLTILSSCSASAVLRAVSSTSLPPAPEALAGLPSNCAQFNFSAQHCISMYWCKTRLYSQMSSGALALR